MKRSPSLFLLCVLCVFARDSLSAEEPSTPVFTVQTAGGATAKGPLRELSKDWSVRLGGADAIRVENLDLLSLHRADKPLPKFPGEEQVIFANGDRLPGKLRKLAGERVLFIPDFGDGKEMSLPLAALSVIWLTAADNSEDHAKERRRLAAEQRTRDAVKLRNGDALEGILTGIDSEQKTVRVEVEKKSIEVSYDKVAAIALNTELTATLKPKGPYGRIILANGCRLSLVSAALEDEGKMLAGTTLFGATVRVPIEQLVALYTYQGKAVYLSDLKPREYLPIPHRDVKWPLVPDANVWGQDLCLAGGIYDKGLGMHSACRVTYELKDKYQRFEALVGLDKTGVKGSVRIQVLVDGKAQDLGGPKDLTQRNGPLPVKIKVAGARELTLVVEFGQGGDVQDDVDWVDARLVK